MYIYTIYIYILYIIHHSHELKFWGWKQGSKTIRLTHQQRWLQPMGSSSPKFIWSKIFSCSQSFRGGERLCFFCLVAWLPLNFMGWNCHLLGLNPWKNAPFFLHHQDLIILSCTPKTGSSNLKLCTEEEILDLEIVMFQVPCFVSKGMCMSQFPSSCMIIFRLLPSKIPLHALVLHLLFEHPHLCWQLNRKKYLQTHKNPLILRDIICKSARYQQYGMSESKPGQIIINHAPTWDSLMKLGQKKQFLSPGSWLQNQGHPYPLENNRILKGGWWFP